MAKTVLVVEDNEDHATIAMAVLTSAGYNVVHADNAAAAGRVVATQTPDMILLDVKLPGKSGVSWLADLRYEKGVVDVPVAVYTSYADIFSPTLRQLGVTAIIDKSENPSQLVDKIRAAIGEA